MNLARLIKKGEEGVELRYRLEYRLDEKLLLDCETKVDELAKKLDSDLDLHFIPVIAAIIKKYIGLERKCFYEIYYKIGYEMFGQKEGIWFQLSTFGHHSSIENYVGCYVLKQETYSNGSLNGLYINYRDIFGEIESKGEYVNELKTGPWLEREEIDCCGRSGFGGCVLESRGKYKNGERCGLWILSYKGKIYFTKKYQNNGSVKITAVNPL